MLDAIYVLHDCNPLIPGLCRLNQHITCFLFPLFWDYNERVADRADYFKVFFFLPLQP